MQIGSSSSMTSTSDLDPALKQALNLLHSPNPKAAEDIRNCLDEIIKQRYGPAKMLINTISKKHLDEEPLAPGYVITIPDSNDEIISLINSPEKTISDSPNTVEESDETTGGIITTISSNNEDVENLKEFGDLKCVVCCEMRFTATNRLVECSKCGSLYHQECHRPHITDEEALDEPEIPWQCTTCYNKFISIAMNNEPVVTTITTATSTSTTTQAKIAKSSASSSRSSSSSTSSSPFYRQEHSSTTSSRHHKSSSSSKSNHHRDQSQLTASSSKGGSSTSSKIIMPNINVISAGDKSSSHSSTKKSHSSSGSGGSKTSSSKSSSSKHHESGSSKRKSSKVNRE